MSRPEKAGTPAEARWLRLSPLMLLVHPVHEVGRQIPVLVGAVVLGSATGNPIYAVLALVLTVVVGLARWFTTSYRIGPGDVQLRTGILQRKVLSLPRNRIRSVSTEARLLHRLFGLAVVRVSTGQEGRGDTEFALDGIEARRVPELRAELLAESLAGDEEQPAPGRVLARWAPSWLRYAPLSSAGLLTVAAALGIAAQTGLVAVLEDSEIGAFGAATVARFGVLGVVAIVAAGLIAAAVLASVLQSLLNYANLELRRDAEVLHLRHGLLRVREQTFDMRRLRGGTLREPLLARAIGGAQLDAVMTGVGGTGEASMLLPLCPRTTAEAVLDDLIGRPEVVHGPLSGHGPAATRRRWTRALALPVLAAVVLAVAAAPLWVWPLWAVFTAGCALLAHDRSRSLGHRVGDGWLVARAGSLERRRDCIEAAGIIGWTVRQTFMQRRAGVATLIAATAAGAKSYRILDVPADLAWSVAAQTTGWVADTTWARSGSGLR